METHGVSTSKSNRVSSVDDVLEYVKNYTAPYVLKVDGLAAGKGVFICKDINSLRESAQEVFVEKKFGNQQKALLEEFQTGEELSLLVLTNGVGFSLLPLCRDHKRLLDNDKGPNTGGMGVVAPIDVDSEDLQKITNQIIEPTLAGLQKQDIDYRGVLYFGVIMSPNGPKLLEYNVRFGDPEAQAILALFDGDWADVFLDLSKGKLRDLHWKNKFCTCVILASEQYPYQASEPAEINDRGQDIAETYILHSGSMLKEESFYASGGRVINIVSLSDNKENSFSEAYKRVSEINFKGMQFRSDIKF